MTENLVPQVKQRYEEFLTTLAQFHAFEEDLRRGLKKAYDEGRSDDLADIGYFLRKSEQALEELRKEVSAKVQYTTNRIAMFVAQRSMEDPDAPGNVRGIFCVATPDVKSGLKTPTKGTEEYAELCDYMGVKREFTARGLIGFSYRRMSDYVDECRATDQPIPPGLELNHDRTVCTYRKNVKKD